MFYIYSFLFFKKNKKNERIKKKYVINISNILLKKIEMNSLNNTFLQSNETRQQKKDLNQQPNHNEIYNIPSFLMNNQTNQQSHMIQQSNVNGLYPKSKPIDRHAVSTDTKLRRGDLSSARGKNVHIEKRNLLTRTPGTGPNKIPGHANNKYIDISSRIRGGLDTRAEGRACGDYADVYIDTFTPLVPCLKDHVQNIEHIIPVYWVRGGASTRTVIRNIDYLRMCGIKE